jgi:hypothetical protein
MPIHHLDRLGRGPLRRLARHDQRPDALVANLGDVTRRQDVMVDVDAMWCGHDFHCFPS